MAVQDENWCYCNKCQGLFYAGSPTFGTCPMGGEHDSEGSVSYSLTSTDPNEPKSPPDLPSPLEGQGQSSDGQPEYGVPLVSDPRAPELPKKKGRSFLKILLVVVLLYSAVASAFSYVNTLLHDPASNVVNQYYTAITHQDYATAFGYQAGATDLPGGEAFTQTLFTQAGQDLDRAKGKVRSYSIFSSSYSKKEFGTGKFTSNKSAYKVDTGDVTVSVTRNGPPYYVNLQLQQRGNDWKIISLDGF